MVDRLLRFCLENKLVVGLVTVVVLAWGVLVAPFDWELEGLPRDPVPVDAIPDLGENQQIVFTEWPGRSPQDVEDQITYPLTVALLGVPGVETVRSTSMFGFSSIQVVFDEDVDFYWARSRIVEKLASLPAGTVPEGVSPALGPDATGLGQVFWYTLEGRAPDGRPAGGWDPQELRSIQDWYVRYALQSVDGVSEVASVGGFVKEYQIDVDPDAMRAYGVTLGEVFEAVRMSNLDVGARTIELNDAEYVVRGLGFVESVADLERTVVAVRDNVPVYVENIAEVGLGPAQRRGALDKAGAEAVGGVVVVRYGANPMAVIQAVKDEIAKIASGLPQKVLDDGTVSRVTVVPFYDRSGLIQETLGTLETALTDEVLVTIVVVLVMVGHLGSSLLISGMLPLAVLMTFIAMKGFGVDANVVALSGIAIAIGTMVDMGIVVCENVLRHLERADPKESRLEVVFRGASEVGSAVLTAVLTTVVSFLPVFAMEAAEGKLFKPLAFTKTFALLASIAVALTIVPAAVHVMLAREGRSGRIARVLQAVILIAVAAWAWTAVVWWVGVAVAAVALWRLVEARLPPRAARAVRRAASLAVAAVVAVVLARHWAPLGIERDVANVVFTVTVLGGLLLLFSLFRRAYEAMLRACLRLKVLFLAVPAVLVVFGACVWLGFESVFAFVPRALAAAGVEEQDVRTSEPWSALAHALPGLGEEFMPRLDEGAFLLMPVTMAHASIGEAMDVLQKQDTAIRAIPEVDEVVGKIGRVESAIDPAPVSMIETVITYVPEFRSDESGRPLTFRFDEEADAFARDERGALIPDPEGRPFRQWRPEIESSDDIWDRVAAAARIPGTTTASKLGPIETRQIMLQTGMRAPMGVKVFGPDLETVERVGLEIEAALQEVPGIRPETVFADRIVGKPYLEIEIDRGAIARYGIHVRDVQQVIEVAIGGKRITTTVEGRERYPVRVRYLRELRDSPEALERILVPGAGGVQIPLGDLAEIRYRPGPQAIKSEDTFLVGYVLFDKQRDAAEVAVVEDAQRLLQAKIDAGELVIPPGVSYEFAGQYENQVRAERKLAVVLPLALFTIFLILYLQFRRVAPTLMVFSGVAVAWAGGFLMLWLYGQPWFLDFSVAGVGMRDLFQVGPVNLSVAVWVGFLALFGIATDDGVIMATYLGQKFGERRPSTRAEVREAVVAAGLQRIRPCLMTIATTILALLPVLTSRGKGADVMVPMAIPTFGGMVLVIVTVFVVPTLWSALEEWRVARIGDGAREGAAGAAEERP